MNTNEESTATIEEGDSGDQPVLPTADQQPIHQQAAQFARQHPVITVAGGLAIGALAAALIPDRNRKYIARQSSQLAEAITATGAAIAQQAASQASSAGSTLRDQAASSRRQARPAPRDQHCAIRPLRWPNAPDRLAMPQSSRPRP